MRRDRVQGSTVTHSEVTGDKADRHFRMACGRWILANRGMRAEVPRALELLHEGLTLHLARFLIAPLGAQRVGQEPSRLSLRAGIAARERERLAPAPFRLVRVALREPQPPELDPQQGIIGFDAKRPLERRGGAVKVAMGGEGLCLRHERASGGREMILA
jgi:hypothetical protein